MNSQRRNAPAAERTAVKNDSTLFDSISIASTISSDSVKIRILNHGVLNFLCSQPKGDGIMWSLAPAYHALVSMNAVNHRELAVEEIIATSISQAYLGVI